MRDDLSFDLTRRARYAQAAGIYRIVPAGVARPRTVAALRALLPEAAAAGWSLVPRGAGTGMAGGNVGSGVILDLSALDPGRCEIDPVARRAVVSPSLPLAALQAAAGPHGLRFPPDPSSARWATLGGMTATNAAGAHSVRYGSVRRWVSALTLETLDGPLTLTRGAAPDPQHPVVQRLSRTAVPLIHALPDAALARWPATTKHSVGYDLQAYRQSGDLIDLVIGSEGTLGAISSLTLRLDPIPPSRLVLRLMVRDRAALVPVVRALRAVQASSIEFLDRTFLQLVDPTMAGEAAELVPRAGGVVLAELEGAADAVLAQEAETVLAAVAPSIYRGDVAADAAGMAALWAIRHGASPALARLGDGRPSLQVIEDTAVPLEALPEHLEDVERICREEGVAVVLFGHAGDGHVHANLLPDLQDPAWQDRVGRIYHRVHAAVIARGGTPSGEHGVGRLRAAVLKPCLGDALHQVVGAVKEAVDPTGLWNPGVILPGTADPLDQLKVGHGAVELPPGISQQLRRIETTADWGADRWG